MAEGKTGKAMADDGRDEPTGEGMADGANDSTAGQPQNLDIVFGQIKKLVRMLLEIVQSANKEITNVKKEGVKAEYNAKDAYRDVLQVVSTAYDYLDKVDNVFQYGEQATRRLATSIRCGNSHLFCDAIKQLSSKLTENGCFYQKFKEACEVAQKNSKQVGTEVKDRKCEVEGMGLRVTLEVVGKAISSVGIPAVVSSGTSTPFSILAIVAGVGIGYGALATARDYNGVRKSFQELSDKFKKLDITIIHINTAITDIDRLLRTMADRIKDAETFANAHVQAKKKIRLDSGPHIPNENTVENEEGSEETKDDLVSMARRLQQKLKEGHTVIASAKQSIKDKEQKLNKELESLYTST